MTSVSTQDNWEKEKLTITSCTRHYTSRWPVYSPHDPTLQFRHNSFCLSSESLALHSPVVSKAGLPPFPHRVLEIASRYRLWFQIHAGREVLEMSKQGRSQQSNPESASERGPAVPPVSHTGEPRASPVRAFPELTRRRSVPSDPVSWRKQTATRVPLNQVPPHPQNHFSKHHTNHLMGSTSCVL